MSETNAIALAGAAYDKARERDAQFADLLRRVDALELDAHKPFDFTHLIARLEALERPRDATQTLLTEERVEVVRLETDFRKLLAARDAEIAALRAVAFQAQEMAKEIEVQNTSLRAALVKAEIGLKVASQAIREKETLRAREMVDALIQCEKALSDIVALRVSRTETVSSAQKPA